MEGCSLPDLLLSLGSVCLWIYIVVFVINLSVKHLFNQVHAVELSEAHRHKGLKVFKSSWKVLQENELLHLSLLRSAGFADVASLGRSGKTLL